MNNQRITLIGNLTADAELQQTKEGKDYLKLGLACNYKDKDAEGKEIEKTTFYTIYIFGERVKIYKNLKKGDRVFAEGTYSQELYLSKEGNEPKANNKVFVSTFHKVDWVKSEEAEETKAE